MKKFSFILVLLLALVMIWPLVRPGYIPTHDGEFSIIRIWQYAKMMKEGFLYPRWAPDLNSGYGVPLFTFYYPLPYLLGSLFHLLGVSLVDSFKLTIAFCFIVAGLSCFLWLQRLFRTYPATIGAIVFLTVPYWFVDMYVRGSIGEVMAISALMISLLSMEYEKFKLFALSIGVIILSHNIAAFIFLPLLFGYTALRKSNMLTAFLWGLLLTCFFWIPALVEQKFVLGLSNFDFRDHFPSFAQLVVPSWGTGFSRAGWPPDEMSQQLGLVVIGLFVFTVAFLLKERFLSLRRLLFGAVIAFLVTVFFMLEASVSVWELIHPLRFIQYPWRFIALSIPLSALFGAYIGYRSRWLGALFVVTGFVSVISYANPIRYEIRTDQYYLSRAEFTDGTTSVGNSFSTVWLSWQKDRPKQKFEIVDGEASIIQTVSKPTYFKLDIDAEKPTLVMANISYYPGWYVYLDGQKEDLTVQKGRIHFMAPQGQHTLLVRFRQTPLQKVVSAVSLLSLFWLISSGILNLRYAHSNRYFSTRKRT